jgi:catechol 2,3-dioxygenase-like lactoylglutathione lyase family enzyme
VADVRRAKDFYEEGLGLPVKKAFGNKFIVFSGGGRTSDLGVYRREALAKDAAGANGRRRLPRLQHDAHR